MSKKLLARTVIEGGRHNVYNDFRKKAKRQERRRANAYCYSAKFDEEFVEEKAKPYLRKPTWFDEPKFADKLSVMYRWIYAQVGRRWDDVYSDIRAKFNVNTTAGRHLVFDHLLSQIDYGARNIRYISDFKVVDGILTLTEDGKKSLFHSDKKRRRYNWYKRVHYNQDSVSVWMNGRRIRKVGSVWFWMSRAEIFRYCRWCGHSRCDQHGAWRQAKALSDKEIAIISKMTNDELGAWSV